MLRDARVTAFDNSQVPLCTSLGLVQEVVKWFVFYITVYVVALARICVIYVTTVDDSVLVCTALSQFNL